MDLVWTRDSECGWKLVGDHFDADKLFESIQLVAKEEYSDRPAADLNAWYAMNAAAFGFSMDDLTKPNKENAIPADSLRSELKKTETLVNSASDVAGKFEVYDKAGSETFESFDNYDSDSSDDDEEEDY